MKKIQGFVVAAMAAAMVCSLTMPVVNGVRADAAVAINEENFPDATFRDYVAEKFDSNGDMELSSEEIAAVTLISVNQKTLTSLEGLEYFTELETLYCDNCRLTSLDVSNNRRLVRLECYANQLTELDVSNNTALEYLYCYNNQLTELDVSNNRALINLSCSHNQLTSLDLSNNTQLDSLHCNDNNLTSLDVSLASSLYELYCSRNQLVSLNVMGDASLNILYCNDNQLTTLDVSYNTNLTWFYCENNQLTSLTLGSHERISDIDCSNNQLTDIDLSGLESLSTFNCENNQLTSLDVSNFPYLINLYCDNNQLTSLDISSNEELYSLSCAGNKLTEIDTSNNPYLGVLYCANNPLTSLDLSNNEIDTLDISQTNIETVDISECNNLLRMLRDEDTVLSCHDEFNPTAAPELYIGGTLGYSHTENDYTYYSYGYDEDLHYGLYYGYLSFTAGQGLIFDEGGEVVYPAGEPSPATGVEGFIARLYSEVLGREADQGGIDYWVDQLNNGTTGGDAARFFLCSEEFLNNAMTDEEFVGVLYAVFFDRTPDEGGLNYWMSEVTGKGKENVINSLIESQEWANICENYGIATGAGTGSTSSDPIVAFAERLYTTCLGRAGEQGGIDFWSAELRAGRSSGSDAARGFFFGSEFMNAGHDNTEFVTRLYRTFFNREPDAGGLNYWLGELGNGTSREAAFNTFTSCQEWLNTCSDAGIQP